MNTLGVIFPYKRYGIWAFDDAAVGLVQEPFVLGTPEIIETFVRNIPDAENVFTLFFPATPFPRYQIELIWVREEGGEGTSPSGWTALWVERRYVAEVFRNVIRRVDLDTGTISTVLASRKLEALDGIAVDSTGNPIITEFTMDRVRKIKITDRTVLCHEYLA